MKAISASECLKTLRYLELQWCNWDDEQNCEELANLVANAPSLKEVWIGAQKGTSDLKIKLEVSGEFVAVERVSSGEVVSSVERACNTVRISVKDGVKKAVPGIIKAVIQETMRENNFKKTFADVLLY